jgi:hypothetical protein
MNTHKRQKENIKKRIQQGVFKACSKPIATSSERIYSETGRSLEARKQLLIFESLDSLVFYVILDKSFLWLLNYENRLNIFSYEIKFEIGTMQKY